MDSRVVVTSDLLTAARDYAERGWPVFPCAPGEKVPLGKLAPHGLKNATTDPAVITRWWTAEPEANIGLPTGLVFDVLDVDGPEALDALESVGGPAEMHEVDGLLVCDDDIEGPTVSTPRGWHCYVGPTGRGNAVNLGALPGVDWRGRGGYVIAPPSRKADGGTWGWITGTWMDLGADTPIRPAPDWVLDLFDRKASPAVTTGTQSRHAGRTGYGAAALERELGRLVMAPEGTRNHQLNRSAHALGQLVAVGTLTADEVIVALVNAGRRIALGEQEIEKTIESGLSSGLRSPRKVAQ